MVNGGSGCYNPACKNWIRESKMRFTTPTKEKRASKGNLTRMLVVVGEVCLQVGGGRLVGCRKCLTDWLRCCYGWWISPRLPPLRFFLAPKQRCALRHTRTTAYNRCRGSLDAEDKVGPKKMVATLVVSFDGGRVCRAARMN